MFFHKSAYIFVILALVVTIFGGNMTILLTKQLALTEDATPFIEQYIDYVRALNPHDLYEGMKDKQILKNKFIFEIHQLKNLDLANINFDMKTDHINVTACLWDSKPVNLGELPLSAEYRRYIAQGAYPTLKITGGNYKKVVTNDDDKDVIEDHVEPYGIILELHEADTTDYRSKKIDTIYQATFKTEHSLITLSKNMMRCFAIFGLLLGLGFMFLGFFLTGLMIIIAFFGVNSYTLLIADIHMQDQRQQVN